MMFPLLPIYNVLSTLDDGTAEYQSETSCTDDDTSVAHITPVPAWQPGERSYACSIPISMTYVCHV